MAKDITVYIEQFARTLSRRRVLAHGMKSATVLALSAVLGSTIAGKQAEASPPCDFPWGNCNPRDCSGAYCQWYCSFNYYYHTPYACWVLSGVECW